MVGEGEAEERGELESRRAEEHERRGRFGTREPRKDAKAQALECLDDLRFRSINGKLCH